MNPIRSSINVSNYATVSGVGRNGFPDKFSTLNCLLLLEFLIFLQFFFANSSQIGCLKSYSSFLAYLISKNFKSVRKTKIYPFLGFENSNILKFFLQKLGPGIKKSYCMILDIPYGKSLQKTVCKNIKNSRRR